jgi:hypothetical protein
MSVIQTKRTHNCGRYSNFVFISVSPCNRMQRSGAELAHTDYVVRVATK